MVKRMLIDATHSEETRVVVVNGTRLEELDVETSTKKQLKGNIYLAKVIRVEPSLQAAFVDYGGNRHGFLAFSEIHPDYFQIPVADRQALLAAQNALTRRADSEAGFDGPEDAAPAEDAQAADSVSANEDGADADDQSDEAHADSAPALVAVPLSVADIPQVSEAFDADEAASDQAVEAEAVTQAEPAAIDAETVDAVDEGEDSAEVEPAAESDADVQPPQPVDVIGGDDAAEQELERRRARLLRNYKIQEVIKRRQIMLVQVVKEERGNKGAALTTYLSLAGRYCVLMPNTARGGGVSRKIINAVDRKRLKAIAQEMEVPESMAVIVRTAGSERSKIEIKRDYEYLLRAWDTVRDLTLKSSAPTLVYEEASLIKRSIRDLYARDIDEILVDGDEGYRLAKDYMRMLTPSHAKKVQPYKDPAVPLFYRYQVESQLDAMHQPVVQLRSGGYLVIGQTEALVAIDVNSGRATRERHIEETALKTNLEAADEVARQLRLRDLAGLVVIDFIDMEESRNNYAVERRLKEALKNDRARIQVGRISAFGLLELSRQRLRPSLQETAFIQCPHCAGTGLIRSVESASVAILRAIEEEGIRARSSEITVWVPTPIALYLLNQKREALTLAEQRYGFQVFLLGDDSLVSPNFRMDRVRAEGRPEEGRILPPPPTAIQAVEDEDGDEDSEEENQEEGSSARSEDGGEDGAQRRRRRRRRRRGRGDQPSQLELAADGSEEGEVAEAGEAEGGDESEAGAAGEGNPEETEEERNRRRRRGRRGGRRRNRGFEQQPGTEEQPVEEVKRFSRDDVADVFEAAELAELAALEAKNNPQPMAETPVAAAAEDTAVVETVAADGGEKPAPRRRAPARKKAAASEDAASDAPAAETAEAPKRRRAPARKKVVEAEAVIETTPAEVQETPAVAVAAPEPEAPPAAAVADLPEPVAPAPVEPPPAPVVVQEQVPEGPPKKGWWNRLMS